MRDSIILILLEAVANLVNGPDRKPGESPVWRWALVGGVLVATVAAIIFVVLTQGRT